MAALANLCLCHGFFSKHKFSSLFALPLLFFGLSLHWINFSVTTWSTPDANCMAKELEHVQRLDTIELQLKYSNGSSVASIAEKLSGATCPEHFRWIHEDLRPWATYGISRKTLESAKRFAHFRLVIINGRLYLEKYQDSFQTRDLFTIWGIVQLLRLYPGRVPDLELMFECGDLPKIQKGDYQGPNASWPPPSLFQYSGNDAAFAIIFPDWSFWGWAEVNIKPWTITLEDIIKGSQRKQWKKREPYAYWRGTSTVSLLRHKLIMECNVSHQYDWHARLYHQDWREEAKIGYKNSKLEDQCTHRYRIYIEGRAWSVSKKYILACDSMALFVKPEFYDFFTRSIVPMQHFWHIRPESMCRDIKLAVEWGNNHTDQAEAIGKAGSKFIQENLKMEYVYDYMFHALNEYAKLMKFKPTIPKGAIEVCSETMASSQNGTLKKFMEQSMVKSPLQTLPCTMPPPYDSKALQAIFERKYSNYRLVETWEDEFWKCRNNTDPYDHHVNP